MSISTADILNAANQYPELKQSELIRAMGWEDNAALRMKVSRAFKTLDKNGPKPEPQISPAPQKVEEIVTPDVKLVNRLEGSDPVLVWVDKAKPITPALNMRAYAMTANPESITVVPRVPKPEPQPEPLQPAPVKPSGFARFVTISLIVIGCIVSGITSFHFTLFSEMGMPLAFSVILSLALEAGFWACLIQVTHKDSDHYYTFAVMSWSLILYRLLANTSGIYTHALAADPVLFGHHIKSGGMWWYAIGLSALLTLCDVAIAKITVERITHKAEQP